MTTPFIPSPHEEDRLPTKGSGWDVVAEYRRSLNAQFGWEEPTNVTHTHDPEWRDRIMSVQAARDIVRSVTGGSWVWKVVGVLWLVASMSSWGIGMMLWWRFIG